MHIGSVRRGVFDHMGAGHRAALGITALTNALAVSISESNGDVRVFSHGKLFMEIEKRRKIFNTG